MPKRIDKLTEEQKARMGPWAEQWIERGLSTAPADFEAWEEGARACYWYTGIAWPGVVVRVGNPLVLALAAPIAAHLLKSRGGAVHDAVGGAVGVAVGVAVRDAVRGAVDDAVGNAVRDAVRGAVRGAVDDAVGGAVHDAVGVAVGVAVRDAVDDAVGGAVSDAVRDAVGGAVRGAVGGAVGGAGHVAVHDAWWKYLGGTFWLSWRAWTSYFRDVCGLELPGDLWDRDRAYAQAQQSAGWWWPHRQFVMVCDRPKEIHRERVGPDGWGSHRLHHDTGPAISWRDGFALYFVHGVRVRERVVMRPETITAAEVLAEPNSEVQRIMAERMGWERFLAESGAEEIHRDDWGILYRRRLVDEDALFVKVVNSTPEPDGSVKDYVLAVHPELRPMSRGRGGEPVLGRPQKLTARNAVGSTFGLRGEEYAPLYES
jgi:hypothetical protein